MVLIKARENIRILDSKTTGGVALCAGDSQDVRSAVILERLLREGVEMKDGSRAPSIRVPLEQLGKIVGKSIADTERVSNAVRNLLEKTTTTKFVVSSSKSMLPMKRLNSGKSLAELRVKSTQLPSRHSFIQDKQLEKNRTHTSSTSTSRAKGFSSQLENIKKCNDESPCAIVYDMQVKPKYLFDLSMRLQSKIFDPDTCNKVSSAVFEALVNRLIQEEGKNMTKRKAILEDLEMNAKQFEGACLFLVNKELDGGILYDDYSRKKRRSMYDSDDEEDVDLTIDDIANELRIETIGFENFVKSISDMILHLLKEIKSKPVEKEKKRGKKEVSVPSNTSNGILNTLNDYNRDVDAADDEDIQQIEPQTCKPRYIDFDEYTKWKHDVLAMITTSSETTEEAMTRVADEIASSYLDGSFQLKF